MNRINEVFKRKKGHPVLSVYCTAGFPKKESTLAIMEALQENGADMIELGIPYSDPLADGPVIQASSMQALANGMTISILFSQLKNFRKKIHVPVLLMGYLNPILQFGFEQFCAAAHECGIDGLIVPDLPIYEYENEYGDIIKKYELDFVFLVTPETSEQRIRKLDGLSSGFLYAVSSSSTTGKNKRIADQSEYFMRIKSLDLKNPVLVGFGIRDKETFQAACEFTDGAIIGTAYIQAIAGGHNPADSTRNFLEGILDR
jgi:tryptophan synthase alpha chain